MAPAIATKTETISSANAETNVVAAPAGIVDGDLLLYVLVTDGAGSSYIVPTGFTEITPADGDRAPSDAAVLIVAWKIASSESGSYTADWTGGQHSIGRMYRITGALSPEVFAPSTVNTGTGNPILSTPFVTDARDTLAFAFTALDRDFGSSSELGSGWTNEDWDETSGSGPEVASGVSIKAVATKGTDTLASERSTSVSEEWVTRQIGIRGSFSATVSHTTDSFLAQHFQKHTTDSLLKAIGKTLSHTTDSYLANLRTLTHTTDSLLVFGRTLDHTTDSLLKKLGNILSHTTDSLLHVVNSLTHDTDSLLKAIGTEVNHDTDSLLKKLDNEISHDTDSLLKALDNELSHNTDSLLRAIQTLSHTTDSNLIQTLSRTRTHDTDSLLKKLGNTLSHTTDSFIAPSGGIIGKKIEADLCVTDEVQEDLCRTDESEVDLCA